jgi:hypothetical protein
MKRKSKRQSRRPVNQRKETSENVPLYSTEDYKALEVCRQMKF